MYRTLAPEVNKKIRGGFLGQRLQDLVCVSCVGIIGLAISTGIVEGEKENLAIRDVCIKILSNISDSMGVIFSSSNFLI